MLIQRSLIYLAFFSLLTGCMPSPGEKLLLSPNSLTNDRTWVGPDFWANRLQDWKLTDRMATLDAPGLDKPLRTLHVLTHRLSNRPEAFRTRVAIHIPEASNDEASAGFLVGGGATLDYRAAALIHHSPGPGAGYYAGRDAQGSLFLKNLHTGAQVGQLDSALPPTEGPITLTLEGTPVEDGYALHLSTVEFPDYALSATLSDVTLEGSIALVAEFAPYGFQDLLLEGAKLDAFPDRNAGPVLGTQYTLHDNILKLTAQFMPVGTEDPQTATLEILRAGSWEAVDEATLVVPGYTAPFRVENWDATLDTPYRVIYDLPQGDQQPVRYAFDGTIQKDPIEKPVVSVAGFTGNHNTARGVESGTFQWEDQVWFPHNDIVDKVAGQDIDVLFFSGDQVYEGASPTFPDRANAHLDYLYKWYLWSWAFRDITRDRPTITIPDDHDVYQGNIWGAGGPPTDKDDKGGYVMPADWVKMIERTQTSHLPDAYDPTPIQQGIGVYYTDMTYGRVGIAIIEDRKFKSGCAGLVPGKEGRPDHFPEPSFDPAIVDLPGLTLLGNRQLDFLTDWTSDWRGQDMKLVVSQTVFANMATHHGANLQRLYGDLDSNGWPVGGRNKALRAIRKGFAFMLQGDQHLSTIVHHGVDQHRDAGFSFCVPSIANFYPRGWQPEAEGINRDPGAPPHMGDHFDGFRNRVTVYGATNPTNLTGISTGKAPLQLHDKMPGHGVVRFNKTNRTITMENWPRYANPDDPSTGGQYEGWPRTIQMQDNYGREAFDYLPEITVTGMVDPVLQVIEEASGEIVYTLRIQGTTYRPKVFAPGLYTLRIGDQDNGGMEQLEGLRAGDTEPVSVAF